MFLMVGTFGPEAVARLKGKGDAAALQAEVARYVTDVGGQIDQFYFIAGDISFVSIIEFPRPAAASIVYGLSSSGLLAPQTLRVNRVGEDMAVIDRDLARAAEMGQPWPVAGEGEA